MLEERIFLSFVCDLCGASFTVRPGGKTLADVGWRELKGSRLGEQALHVCRLCLTDLEVPWDGPPQADELAHPSSE